MMMDQRFENPQEILIVEDSATQREHLRYVLEQHGFNVIAAANGREALDLIGRHLPGLIITDVTMPEMDGYELCRRLRKDESLQRVPVILLTSLSDPEDVFKGLECGADNFITKPYEAEYLMSGIHYLLANLHLRTRDKMQLSMEVILAGRKHVITSDRAQILNLLLSTYETAIQKNRELSHAKEELAEMNLQLERKVNERTAWLAAEIAERRRAEEEVRELNQDLEQRVKERTADLESFSYSVSHDLRAPLRAIDGFSNLLMNQYGAGFTPDARHLLNNVIVSARHMGMLIDSLLQLSRLGGTDLSKAVVDVSALVREIIDELQKQNTERMVKVEVADLPDCTGDAGLIRQVFVNLLSNAFKFTRHRTRPFIHVGGGVQGGHLQFFVRDNGAGFDMRYSNKLFGVFQRLHRNEEFEGVGVGLSIVQRIVQRHGGEIWAEAELDKGATFYFTLPA
jgi:two-component system, sensor histidine kinase and response regulator